MDEKVNKRETWGPPKDWSAALGGMMTLVRVRPPDEYDEIMAIVKEAGTESSRRPAPASPTPAPPSGGAHRH